MRPRSHSGRGGGVRGSPLAFWARELSEVPSARARSHSERGGAVRACPLAFWARELSEVLFARARSRSGRGGVISACPLAFPKCRSREPARILGAGVPFLRARSQSGRASSPRCRPREPARVMGAEVAFVRAQSHSVRVDSSLPASASSLSYPERVSSPILSPCFKMLRNIYSHWVGAAVVQAPRM